jgi:hypothetical protein
MTQQDKPTAPSATTQARLSRGGHLQDSSKQQARIEPMEHLIARSEKMVAACERWTDDEMLAALRGVASAFGKCTTGTYWEAYESGWPIPTPTIVMHRFSGWSNALAAADLPTRGPSRHYRTRIPNEALWSEVRRCAAAIGQIPPTEQYDAWARSCGAPCLSLVRRRLGGWRTVLRELSEDAA